MITQYAIEMLRLLGAAFVWMAAAGMVLSGLAQIAGMPDHATQMYESAVLLGASGLLIERLVQ
jgi:hypothetical protein